jgi:hypothetical protein
LNYLYDKRTFESEFEYPGIPFSWSEDVIEYINAIKKYIPTKLDSIVDNLPLELDFLYDPDMEIYKKARSYIDIVSDAVNQWEKENPGKTLTFKHPN